MALFADVHSQRVRLFMKYSLIGYKSYLHREAPAMLALSLTSSISPSSVVKPDKKKVSNQSEHFAAAGTWRIDSRWSIR